MLFLPTLLRPAPFLPRQKEVCTRSLIPGKSHSPGDDFGHFVGVLTGRDRLVLRFNNLKEKPFIR